MPNSRRKPTPTSRGKPPATLEELENQIGYKAVKLAERQIDDGTVSAQVQTHYIKLVSSRERLEQDRLRKENELLSAKVKALDSQVRSEELLQEALEAFTEYSGRGTNDHEY